MPAVVYSNLNCEDTGCARLQYSSTVLPVLELRSRASELPENVNIVEHRKLYECNLTRLMGPGTYSGGR